MARAVSPLLLALAQTPLSFATPSLVEIVSDNTSFSNAASGGSGAGAMTYAPAIPAWPMLLPAPGLLHQLPRALPPSRLLNYPITLTALTTEKELVTRDLILTVVEGLPYNEYILGSEGFCELHAFQALQAEFNFPAIDPDNTTWAITAGSSPNGLTLDVDVGLAAILPQKLGSLASPLKGITATLVIFTLSP